MSTTYYQSYISKSEPYAFYHRAIPLKGNLIQVDRTNICKEFLKAFLHPESWEYFKQFGCEFPADKRNWAAKWGALDNAFVNFSHFARVKEEACGWSFTKFGIFHAWRRHAAYFMGEQFPCIDLLIPLAYIEADGTITPENMAYILISVQNHSGKSHDSLSKQYLEEEFVLGTPNEGGRVLKPKSKSTLLLSLRTLPFILCQDEDNSAEDDIDGQQQVETHDWIKVTERNPYIAFVMSIGSGSMEGVRRFVPEKQVLKADSQT